MGQSPYDHGQLPMTEPSAFDEVLQAVQSALHARRRRTFDDVAQIRALLDAYLVAVEQSIAHEFAEQHGLKRPKSSAGAARDAARALLERVSALPEIESIETGGAPASEGPSIAQPPSARGPLTAKAPQSAEPRPGAATAPPPPSSLPKLHAAVAQCPVVVVGGVARREKLADIPAPIRDNIEWIDTTRQGTHAIGNLEKRIRDRRVAALILLEGLVSHRHSEPLVSAAKRAGVVIHFAGKGAKAALQAALADLEGKL